MRFSVKLQHLSRTVFCHVLSRDAGTCSGRTIDLRPPGKVLQGKALLFAVVQLLQWY